MPRLNTTLKRNKYVLRRRPVSKTSNSGNSDTSSTSALQNNMAEADSITNIKSENSTSSLNTEYSSDDCNEHDYSFKKRTNDLQSFDMKSVFKDASNFNHSTDCTAENVDMQDKINLGLNKNSRVINTSKRNIRSRSNKSRSSTTNEYSELMNTYKQSHKSLSKNAINAKLNRIKKKEHTTQLENEITSLREENTNLQSCINFNSKTISSLRNEVKFLRNILANSKELGTILRNVCRNTNLNIISPLDRTTLNKSTSYQEIKANVDTNMLNGLEADSFISGTYLYSSAYTPDIPESPFKPLHSQPTINSCEDLFMNKSEPDNNETSLNDSLFDCFQFGLLEMDNTLKCESIPTEENDELMLWDKCPLEVNNLSNFNQDVGVCLHISNKEVSLEFCASCNQSCTSFN